MNFYYEYCLDVFCLLSTDNEGVSQASLQAAFLKKPLVTTSTGGLKEVCLQGKTGLIVDKNSPQQVSEAIRYLYKHPQDRHHFGENAHSLVREKFTFAQTVQQMEKIFKELV